MMDVLPDQDRALQVGDNYMGERDVGHRRTGYLNAPRSFDMRP